MPNLNTWGEIQNMLKIEYHWKHVLWIAISKLMQISLFDTSNLHKYSISKCIWKITRSLSENTSTNWNLSGLDFYWYVYFHLLIKTHCRVHLESYIFFCILWMHFSNLNAKANVTFVSLKSFNVHYEWWRICIRIKV